MKKIVALLVIVSIIISFSSCKEEDTSLSKPSYTNISLKDAQMYIGLTIDEAEDIFESKGFFQNPYFVDTHKNPPSIQFTTFRNSDNTVWYEIGYAVGSSIIFQVDVFKKSMIRDNSISNYEYCQRECILATNNNSDYYYVGYFQPFFEPFDSQSEFQYFFNANKSIIDYCIEGWNSTNISFSVSFIERNEENSNVTETSTIVQSDKYYLFNVGYSDRSYQWK